MVSSSNDGKKNILIFQFKDIFLTTTSIISSNLDHSRPPNTFCAKFKHTDTVNDRTPSNILEYEHNDNLIHRVDFKKRVRGLISH